MRQFPRFEPNRKATFVCSKCPHTFDRHVIGKTFRGCLVKDCLCYGMGTFSRPVPPVIEEYVTYFKTHKRVLVNQPAPPVQLGTV